MTKAEKILSIAQDIADERPSFFDKKGAGKGDRDTNLFMAELRTRAKQSFGRDFSEKKICGDNNLSVDFFIPDEGSIIEIALSLRNPNSEFERDILKVIMAKEQGAHISNLLFLSKPGAIKRHQQPSSIAVKKWVFKNYDIEVAILELSDKHTR
ncbi:MAG: hypothetical protein ABIF87_00045 [Pseudomonadota bacterium]